MRERGWSGRSCRSGRRCNGRPRRLARRAGGVGWAHPYSHYGWNFCSFGGQSAKLIQTDTRSAAYKPVLTPTRTLLGIARGERRGWDPLFYPTKGHGIESPYIESVLLNTRDVSGLTVSASGDAFCFSVSLDKLKQRGDTGALKWIRKFENGVNGTGKSLTDVLATGGRRWYEMSTDSTADFAIGINPEDRIFTARLDKRSFVNQRLIKLSSVGGVDLDLMHALLNSSLSIFFIESSGFGRGLGALDITPTKLKTGMKIIDPAKISKQDRNAIVAAFAPLLKRNVLKLDLEMNSRDRVDFDNAVLRSVGMEAYADDIRNAVLEL